MELLLRNAGRLLLMTLGLGLAMACSPPRSEFDTGTDNDAGDALGDTPREAASMDARPDVGSRCTGDRDCTTGANRVCNTATGACVQCLPGAARTCPAGNYCATGMTCMPGCSTNADCDPGDGGIPTRCNTATNTCAGCAGDDECPSGTVCRSATCVAGCSTARPCATGQTCCAGACANTMTDLANCGVCGQRCGNNHATAACNAGTCAFTCAAGYGNCDLIGLNGCEESLASSITNCGACSHFCQFTNATGECAAGSCNVLSCSAGFQDCDRMGDNGCEADVNTSTTNCGRCGTACDVANAQICNAGTCACPTGWTICPGGTRCIDTSADASNCGACGSACPAGQFCTGGTCNSDIVRYTNMPAPSSVVFVDICAMAGTIVQLPGVDDAVGSDVTIPFPFRFFDGMYTTVRGSSNGYIVFGSMVVNPNAYYGTTLPDMDRPRPMFAAYNNDLETTSGICFRTLGTAPNRSLVWMMNDQSLLGDSTGHITIEVFLNEGSNTIDVIYQTLTGSVPSGGDGTLIGMQNQTATRSTQFSYDRAGAVMTGTRLRFVPAGT